MGLRAPFIYLFVYLHLIYDYLYFICLFIYIYIYFFHLFDIFWTYFSLSLSLSQNIYKTRLMFSFFFQSFPMLFSCAVPASVGLWVCQVYLVCTCTLLHVWEHFCQCTKVHLYQSTPVPEHVSLLCDFCIQGHLYDVVTSICSISYISNRVNVRGEHWKRWRYLSE